MRIRETNPMMKLKGKEILIVTNESSTKKRPVRSSMFRLCRICNDRKLTLSMFKETQCKHYFCFICIQKLIARKLKDENVIMVCCPEANCKGLIMPNQCKSIIPAEVICRWNNALLDSTIPLDAVFKCPFEECKANLVDDGEVELECPKCCTRICGECKNFEHGSMDCKEFKEFCLMEELS